MRCNECGCPLFADASKARGICEECVRGEDAVAEFDGLDAEQQLAHATEDRT